MDGLECTERSLKRILDETYDFRMESEYYKKEYLSIQKRLVSINGTTLENIASIVTDGTHFTPEYVPEGIPFLSAVNVQDNYLDFEVGHKFITEETHKLLSKRVLPRKQDVLLRKVGVGTRKACVVGDANSEFSIFVSVALIRSALCPEYLSTFINTKYGQAQLLRFNKGISQPDLHLEDIWKLYVPTFSDAFYHAIAEIINSSYKLRKLAEETLNEAETDFSRYHGFCEANDTSSISTKSLSESFLKTGRIDAEYYHSKYDKLFEKLRKLPTKRLGGEDGIVTIIKSIDPGSDTYCEEGVPFIRVSDVTKYGITEPEIHLRSNALSDIRGLFPKKDAILLSKDGSIGIAYKLDSDMDVITSGALLHLYVKNPQEVLPDYLTLVLNSRIVKLQAERDANGAIIQHWKPSDIENVMIPVPDIPFQTGIAEKVQKSFRQRVQASGLANLAKEAVEMAIEQGEAAALAWVEREVSLAAK